MYPKVESSWRELLPVGEVPHCRKIEEYTTKSFNRLVREVLERAGWMSKMSTAHPSPLYIYKFGQLCGNDGAG